MLVTGRYSGTVSVESRFQLFPATPSDRFRQLGQVLSPCERIKKCRDWQEFVPGGVPGRTRVPLRMTALIWWLKNGVTCSRGVRKNLSYNAADVVGSAVKFEQSGKFASSGVQLRAQVDKILPFLRWLSKSMVVTEIARSPWILGVRGWVRMRLKALFLFVPAPSSDWDCLRPRREKWEMCVRKRQSFRVHCFEDNFRSVDWILEKRHSLESPIYGGSNNIHLCWCGVFPLFHPRPWMCRM